ncbi:MAG: hypothetical protein ACD_59C00101G0001, partial [uncultured bacterium]
HHNMAGGVINAAAGFDAPEMFRSLKSSLEKAGGVPTAAALAEF